MDCFHQQNMYFYSHKEISKKYWHQLHIPYSLAFWLFVLSNFLNHELVDFRLKQNYSLLHSGNFFPSLLSVFFDISFQKEVLVRLSSQKVYILLKHLRLIFFRPGFSPLKLIETLSASCLLCQILNQLHRFLYKLEKAFLKTLQCTPL